MNQSTRTRLRISVLTCLLIGACFTQAALGQQVTTKPLSIFNSNKVTLQVSVDAIGTTPTGQVSYLLSWTLKNASGRPIFVEQGDRMPYVDVTSAGNIDANYTVKDIRPSRIYFFEVPNMVRVANQASLSGTMKIGVPVHSSDHYTLPSTTGTPLTSQFGLTLRIGYMPRAFNVPLTSPVILNRFLDQQLEVTSNTLRL